MLKKYTTRTETALIYFIENNIVDQINFRGHELYQIRCLKARKNT